MRGAPPGPLTLVDRSGISKAVSLEAHAANVRVGQSASAALTLCPGLAIRPYDARVYRDAAEQAWDLLAAESSVVEPVSPEMAFVVLDSRLAPRQAALLARRLSDVVGDPVQVGLGRTRVIAHSAALQARPGRPLRVPRENEALFLASLPLQEMDLPPDLRERLSRLGITRLGDVLAVDPHELSRSLKEALHRLQRIARGGSDDVVAALWPPPVITQAMAFDEPLALLPPLQAAFVELAGRISRSLRQGSRYCRRVSLAVVEESGQTYAREEELARPTSDAAGLTRAAQRLWERLCGQRSAPPAVVSIALQASAIDTGSGVQMVLLDPSGNALPDERAQMLEAAIRRESERAGAAVVVNAGDLEEGALRSFLAASLGHRSDEPVQVDVGVEGEPRCYVRHRQTYPVVVVQDRWHERAWFGDRAADNWVYRVLTPHGLVDLTRRGDGWRLQAIAD